MNLRCGQYLGFYCQRQLYSTSGLTTLAYLKRGMRYTSMALYFDEAPKKSLHKPKANFRNMLFQKNYSFNYYLQLLCLHFDLELT
jgi:hypothetical protein